MWVAVGVGVISAYGAYSAGQAQNRSADIANENARRRYEFKAGITGQQIEEQKMLATEKMTDVTRAFLKAKGTAKAVQAETGVAGNVEHRKQFDLISKESETKGKVAKEIDTNVINIAQGMLAEKIDTDALVREALSRKKSGLDILTDTAVAGMSGYIGATSLGSKFSSLKPTDLSGIKTLGYTPLSK